MLQFVIKKKKRKEERKFTKTARIIRVIIITHHRPLFQNYKLIVIIKLLNIEE